MAPRSKRDLERQMAEQIEQLRESETRLHARTLELAAQGSELELRVREVYALNRSAAALNLSLDLDTVLQSIVDGAAELMSTDLSAIYQWDPATDEMRGRIAAGVNRALLSRIATSVSMAPDLVSRIAAERRPVIVEDMDAPSAPVPGGVLSAAMEHGIRAALAVPLVARDRLYGYLATYYGAPRRFSDHEIVLLSTFAEQAATALENARLYAEARRLAAVEERNRIAREIHDTLAQGLSGLVLQLQGVDRYVTDDPGLAKDELREAIRLARHTLQEARRSVWEFRASALDQVSLEDAVRAEAEVLAEAGIEADFGLEGEATALGAEAEHNLYRIAQEALANVRRHSSARRVRVTLRYLPEAVELVVEDDGVGFSTAREVEAGHFGLMGMRDRARLVGGTLNVESTPGLGTRIQATIPIHSRRNEQ